MKLTDDGLNLIKTFEGFRANAYRDPVGIWTIGYGHTSMAGPPEVKEGMSVTRQEAAIILARDVAAFSDGVRRLLKRQVNDRQFSALVSFAYNVGLENFRKSSVLKAVNDGNDAAVARRLQLWVKAGGRVLPGLVRRRAAEAAMFAGDDGVEQLSPPREVHSLQGKSLFGSSTNLAALLAALSGTVTALSASFKEIAGITGGEPTAMALMSIMLGAAAWIIWERRKRSVEDGV
jgi:lysozyme